MTTLVVGCVGCACPFLRKCQRGLALSGWMERERTRGRAQVILLVGGNFNGVSNVRKEEKSDHREHHGGRVRRGQ
jgi:hypothetical protein